MTAAPQLGSDVVQASERLPAAHSSSFHVARISIGHMSVVPILLLLLLGAVGPRRDCTWIPGLAGVRTWDDLPWASHPVTLVYAQRRVRCRQCGTRTERLEFAEAACLADWDRARPTHRPRYLGADEIHRGKGQPIWTVLSDLVRGEVIGLAKDRSEDSLRTGEIAQQVTIAVRTAHSLSTHPGDPAHTHTRTHRLRK